jgi:excisionase family DNA binding protein
MASVAVLEVAGRLKAEADALRAGQLDAAALAERLEAASDELLEDVPDLSVADVAQLLGQSRPTIYEWVRQGFLLAQAAEGRGLRISPASLLVILPIVMEWQQAGRRERPSRLLRAWYDGAIQRRAQRLAFADQRRRGETDPLPPRHRGPATAG